MTLIPLRRLPFFVLAVTISISIASLDRAAFAGTPCTVDRATGTTIDAPPVLANAWGSRWNLALDRVAYTQPGPDGHYAVSTMRPDGTDRMPLFAEPGKHVGTPYWSPDGRFLIVTVQKPDWSGRALFGVPDYEALPGFGRHDDLWAISSDGRERTQLTTDANTPDQGILIPVLSHDGRRVAWSARLPGGTYELRVADLARTPQLHVRNVRAYRPGGATYYETGSFSSDDRTLLFTSSRDTKSFWRSQIYRLDLRTGSATLLTRGGDYNEHPIVVATPSGDWVVYMSTKGVDRFRFHVFLGTDWYAMRADGSEAKRLTTMNLREPGNPENTGAMQVAGTVTPGPAGEILLGDVQDSLVRQTGAIVRIHLTCR